MPKITKRTPRQGSYQDPGRKDPGHTLNQPRAPRTSAKDTKRWCKGKVGRAHDYTITKQYRASWFSYDMWTCAACGKKDLRRAAANT